PAPALELAETAAGTCPRIVTRVWSASDACGNRRAATQKLTVEDRVAPVLSGVPASAVLECGAAIPEPALVAAHDECAQAPVAFGETRTGDRCNLVETRTWSASDGCNVASAEQTIAVRDTAAPTAVALLRPLPPRVPAPPASPSGPDSEPTAPGYTAALFEVDASASDACNPVATIGAALRLTSFEVPAGGGACSAVSEDVVVQHGDRVEVRLLARPCPESGASVPSPATWVDPDGVRVVVAVDAELRVQASDGCGNSALV